MDLDWICQQQPKMETLLEQWVCINSFSTHVEGLKNMADLLEKAFVPLKATLKRVALPHRTIVDRQGNLIQQPLGEALHIQKYPNAPFHLFLVGHMDTVFSPDSPFQRAERIEGKKMRGPGAADMKGGLVILLTVLQALEQSALAGRVGWEVVINPDEEIGSVGSSELLKQCAVRNDVGLLFEPSFPDGKIASSRKGSAAFTLIARGRAAHSGRDFASGRNAIAALAKVILQAEKLTDLNLGITLNVGQIWGGEAVNIVPALAICRINARATESSALYQVRERLHQIVKEANVQEGIELVMHDDSFTPAKPFDEKQKVLFQLLKESGSELNLNVEWHPSGGACDGNRLHEQGLATIDAMGVVGGGLHTEDEYVYLPSLSERACLAALLISKLVENCQKM